MTTARDVRRSYASPLRTAQAAATRRAIIDAAASLFIERGYVATSIDAIAESAEVGRATVFASVGGKKDLLKAAYDVALRRDGPVASGERAALPAARTERDPERYLVRYAGALTDLD